MKKRIITALLVTTASAPALATYPASQPAQAAEVMVRMCLQQRTGVDKKTAIGRVYDTVSDWPIAQQQRLLRLWMKDGSSLYRIAGLSARKFIS